MKKLLITKLFFFLVIGGIYAQTDVIDPSFNAKIGGGANINVACVTVQTDGKVIIAGEFTNYAYSSKNGIARLNADGTLDTTFDVGTGANASIASIAVLPNGQIMIAGYFTTYNGIVANRIARLNTDGSFDPTFIAGTGSNSYNTLAVQTDGKILLGGYFTTYNGLASKHIIRLNSDGTPDTTFNVGLGPSSTVTKIVVKPDGKIVIIGNFLTYAGISRKGIAQLNTDGTLDLGFNTIGAPGIESVALQPDGKVLIGGYFVAYNFTTKNGIVRLNLDGTVDTTFNLGTANNSSIKEMVVQPNGKIVIGGQFTTYNSTAVNRIARLNNDGSLDTTFDTGTGANETVSSIAIKTNGTILIAGNFTTYNNTPRGRITQLKSDGALDQTFFSPGSFQSGSVGGIYSMVLQPDEKIIIAGNFYIYNGVAKTRIARLNSDGTLDTTFNAYTNSSIECVVLQTDGKILIGGYFTTSNGVSRKYLSRLNANGTLDTSFNIGTGASTSVHAIAVQSDGKILIGGKFTSFNGVVVSGLIRLNPDGAIDTTFAKIILDYAHIESIVLQSDGKILIGGDFYKSDNSIKYNFVRLEPDGTLDATFNSGGVGLPYLSFIEVIKLQTDGKILIGGSFSSYNNTVIQNIARINTDGSVDTSFKPGIMVFVNTGTNQNGSVHAIDVQIDGKILIGGLMNSLEGIAVNGIARLTATGALDPTFDSGYGINDTSINEIIIQPDNKALIAGVFRYYKGIVVSEITRLQSDNSVLANQDFKKESFLIYPNPSFGIFNIESNTSIDNASITVYDLQGRIINQLKTEKFNNKQLDLTPFRNGIYILNISNGSYNYSQKLVKQ